MDVAGGEQRVSSLSLEQVRELRGGRGLARTLQADEHDHVGSAVLRERHLALGRAEELRELVEDDLDDVLRRREGIHDLGGQALLLAVGDEALDDAIVDVGLEQRHADLAHRSVDIVLGETALALELGEGVLETV